MVDLDKLAADFRAAHRRNDREAMADMARQAMGAGERVTFPDGSICDYSGHGAVKTGWPVHFAPPEWMELLGTRVATRCARECMAPWAELCARFAVAAVAVDDQQLARVICGLLNGTAGNAWGGLLRAGETSRCAVDAIYQLHQLRLLLHGYDRASVIGRVFSCSVSAIESLASQSTLRQNEDTAWQLMTPLVCALISPAQSVAMATPDVGGSQWMIKHHVGELTPYHATRARLSTSTIAPA